MLLRKIEEYREHLGMDKWMFYLGIGALLGIIAYVIFCILMEANKVW